MSPAKKTIKPVAVRKNDESAKANFEIAPPPIPDENIKKTFTADVVVVGAGIAGLTAAVSAREAGARTVLIEKGETYHVRGLHNAALNSRLQKKLGVKVDKDRIIHTIMEFGGYRGDQRIVKLWADNCDQTMDWLLDMADEAGIEVVLDLTTKSWYFPHYPLIHVFRPKRQETLAEMLLAKGRSSGAEYYFNTPAVRLIREGKGRVTGVISRNKEGEYIRFEALKGVVLATGDYGHDREMVSKYCPFDGMDDIKCAYPADVNTGDGHKMGLWIGAAMDNVPHCPALFDWAVWAVSGLFNVARQPWLYINKKGERFMNEDLPWGYECNQILRQPGRTAWSVWDSKYNDEIPIMQSQCCKNMGPPTFLWDPRQMVEALEKGNVLTASTIGDLAKKMKVPVKTFKATVARYNELASSGKDLDFGKHSDRLTTLSKPPYYACQMETRFLVILSGLQVNTRLQVLDTRGEAIPGLYAAGNVSGSFFGGNAYSTTTPGVTHSRAWTFGCLAGKNAANDNA